jgi:creatinine deaminase
MKKIENYKFMLEAIKEAKKSLSENGIPIGAVLVKNNQIISRGHNQLKQKNSTILHAEMDCLENAGHLKGSDYKKCTLYTTLVPCDMCAGLVVLYKIPKVIMGENKTFPGPEDYLLTHGVELINLNSIECKQLIDDYIQNNPEIWHEEINRVT